MTVHATAILQPGEIERPKGDITRVLLPSGSVFGDRARRFDQLAAGHTLAGYLGLLAAVSRAQHESLGSMPPLPFPDAGRIEQCRIHGMPPLAVTGTPRDPAWRDLLARIAGALRPGANDELGVALDRLAGFSPVETEALAERVLEGDPADMDAALSPFVAAALQVVWHHLAMRLSVDSVGQGAVANLCPVCGYAPQASILRIGAGEGLRYLHCALCGTEWHMVRVKCSNCESTKGISYLGIEGGSPVVKAEACDECHSYLKIVYQDKDPMADPVADDVASLTLDMLMDEAGYSRSGPNLFLIPGELATA